jgi:hypothetical protein
MCHIDQIILFFQILSPHGGTVQSSKSHFPSRAPIFFARQRDAGKQGKAFAAARISGAFGALACIFPAGSQGYSCPMRP